jgi:iron complex outermembrane receptor protein
MPGTYRATTPAPTAMGMMLSNQKADAAAFNAQDHARNDNNWDLTALARYTANVNTDIEFGFARKVRSPNLYERYTWSTWSMAAVMNNFVGDGNGYIGNIDLEPEKAHTLSATFDWHAADRNWWLKATPYYTRSDRLHRRGSLYRRCRMYANQHHTSNQVRSPQVRQPVGALVWPRPFRPYAAG